MQLNAWNEMELKAEAEEGSAFMGPQSRSWVSQEQVLSYRVPYNSTQADSVVLMILVLCSGSAQAC